MKVYQALVSAIIAQRNCAKSGNIKWFHRHGDRIDEIVKGYLPHGSGFDTGTRVDIEKSSNDKLILYTDYHHMDENGFYDGWSEDVKIVVKPSLCYGITVKITGIRRKNRYDKDYFYDTFHYCLNKEMVNHA